ncbi:MAG: hypothetical protein LQ349_006719 [Xanthoria aureola]|nr:MAG: hypothetical protein LQ349_006719 [Xanthoria aureola]
MPPAGLGSRRISLVATTTILWHILTLVSANCYLPNGTDRNSILWDSHGIDYQPSGFGSSLDNFQMCCATNNRATPDMPRKDGLCQSPDTIWRESCTDPTWKSPSCVKLCIDGINDEGIPRRDSDSTITQCPDLSYCCGDKNTTCCEQGHGVWMKDGEPTTINPNATQPTSTSAILASATSPATSLPTPVPSPPPKPPALSKGAIAGIAVGAVGWVVILAIALYSFILRRKRRRRGMQTFDTAPQPAFGRRPPSAEMKEKASIDQHPARDDSEKGDLPMYPHPPERSGTLRSELSADAPPAELAGEDRAVPAKIGPAAELVGCTPTYRELE